MIDDEQIVAAIDKLISGMRDVSDDLSPAERERMGRLCQAAVRRS
jgi:hypothetical protein